MEKNTDLKLPIFGQIQIIEKNRKKEIEKSEEMFKYPIDIKGQEGNFLLNINQSNVEDLNKDTINLGAQKFKILNKVYYNIHRVKEVSTTIKVIFVLFTLLLFVPLISSQTLSGQIFECCTCNSTTCGGPSAQPVDIANCSYPISPGAIGFLATSYMLENGSNVVNIKSSSYEYAFTGSNTWTCFNGTQSFSSSCTVSCNVTTPAIPCTGDATYCSTHVCNSLSACYCITGNLDPNMYVYTWDGVRHLSQAFGTGPYCYVKDVVTTLNDAISPGSPVIINLNEPYILITTNPTYTYTVLIREDTLSYITQKN